MMKDTDEMIVLCLVHFVCMITTYAKKKRPRGVKRTDPTPVVPQNMRGIGAPGLVRLRLKAKKFSRACLVGEQTQQQKSF